MLGHFPIWELPFVWFKGKNLDITIRENSFEKIGTRIKNKSILIDPYSFKE